MPSGDLTAILSDILLEANINDQKRFKQMVLEAKATLEEDFLAGGDSFALTRLRAMANTGHV